MNPRDGSAGTTHPGSVVPARPPTFVAFLFATAAVLALSTHSLSWQPAVAWRNVVPLFALLVGAERLMMRFRYRGQIDGITLFEAALAPALVTLPIPAVVVLVAAAQTAAALIGRDTPIKAAFNVAQWSVAGAIGGVVFQLLATGGGLSARTILAVVAALTAVSITNIATFTFMMHLVQRESLRVVMDGFAPLLPVWGITLLVNLCFGIIFNASYAWSAMSAVLFFIPLAMLHWASRGYAAVVVDQERLAGMHRASRILAEPVDPRDAIPEFLDEIRKTFSCEVAELTLIDGDVRTVHRARGDAVPSVASERADSGDPSLPAILSRRMQATRVTSRTDDPRLAAALARSGFRDCLAAPLVDGNRIVGILCTYNRGGMEGFDAGEAAVLEALAGDAARAMMKSALLETILEERQKLAEIVGRTSDGILTLTPDGAIGTWNFAFERISGYAAHEMNAETLAALDVRDGNGNCVPLGEWAAIDEPLPADIRVTTRSGETRWLSCSYTRVAEADAAQPSILIVVARDATEAREIERLKDDFVATVSHELRTPLTPIKGWAATLLQLGERLDDAQREEGVRAILRHAERLERLITNILEVTKIERGLSDRRDAVVDMVAVVQKVVEDFRGANPARDIRFAAAGSDLRSRGDELWTEQIVANLVSNALKYAPASEPVDVRIDEFDSRVVVSVVDRGPGIPAGETERIFERFKRLGDHMTRTTSGTGLGLYIARQLAHAIGGELSVYSTPGDGATFTLTLPSVAATDLVHVAS